MATIELSVTPFPLEPAPYEEWRSAWPDYLTAYDKISKAKRHAVQQVGVNPTDEEEEEHLVSARVGGYLLVELFNRRAIISDGPVYHS